MLCKTCNIIMRTGISFEQKKEKTCQNTILSVQNVIIKFIHIMPIFKMKKK